MTRDPRLPDDKNPDGTFLIPDGSVPTYDRMDPVNPGKWWPHQGFWPPRAAAPVDIAYSTTFWLARGGRQWTHSFATPSSATALGEHRRTFRALVKFWLFDPETAPQILQRTTDGTGRPVDPSGGVVPDGSDGVTTVGDKTLAGWGDQL